MHLTALELPHKHAQCGITQDTYTLSLVFPNIVIFMGVLYCFTWIPVTVCCLDVLARRVPFSVSGRAGRLVANSLKVFCLEMSF